MVSREPAAHPSSPRDNFSFQSISKSKSLCFLQRLFLARKGVEQTAGLTDQAVGGRPLLKETKPCDITDKNRRER